MNRKLSIFTLAIFLLLAQGLTFAHIAKYGVEPHKHAGKSCEVFLNSNSSKIAFFDNPADHFSAELFVLENIFSHEQVVLSNLFNPYSSRAPPIFS